jgi:hypothetical protein
MDPKDMIAQQMMGGGGGGMPPPGGPPMGQEAPPQGGGDPAQALGSALMEIGQAMSSGQLDMQTAMQILTEIAGGGGGDPMGGAPQGSAPMPGGMM